MEFEYDGWDRRVGLVEKENGAIVEEKRWLWCGAEICEERDALGGTVVKRYYPQGEAWLSGASTGLYYYIRDHLGSIRELVDTSGVIRARYDYDPYGRRTKVSGDLDSDFGYTGHYYHEPSGVHLALYRAYDANLGRWLSRDPIAEDGGINLYEYVFNNPINWWDPLGLDAWYDVAGDWFFERGLTGDRNSNRRRYDSSHQITQDLMRDEGVQEARNAWNAAGRPDSFSYQYRFGVNDYFRELLTLDGTGSFLGSYEVNITKCPDGSTAFSVKNTTGWESGTRSPIPRAGRNASVEDIINGAPFTPNPRSLLNDRPRSASGPGGNFYQNYYWNEP